MQDSITHEALEALSKKATEARQAYELEPSASTLSICMHAESEFSWALASLYRTGQLILAQPSGDEVEAVARHLCEREILKAYTRPDRADELKEFRKIEVDHLWENYKDLATAAITALDAARGKQ